MRLLKFALFLTFLGMMAATAQAQYRPSIPHFPTPQPYRPPTPPTFPQPANPGFRPPQFHPPPTPQVPVFVKRCSRCGNEVPATSSDGQRCPYCGVVWGTPTGRLTSTQTTNGETSGNAAGTHGQSFKILYLVVAGIAAIGLAGAGVLIWYYCRPVPRKPNYGGMGLKGSAGAAAGAPDWLGNLGTGPRPAQRPSQVNPRSPP
jgi:hypothetical protein